MGRKSDLSPRKRGQIKVLLDVTNLTCRQIAQKCGVSKNSVSRIKIQMEHGSSGSPKRKGKCGRKRLTTVQDERSLVRLSKSNRKFTSRRLMIEMNAAGVQLSSRTVRRRLIEAGLRAYRPRKKPRLTETMKKKRLQWAKQFAKWTVDDWKRVCFSDESTLEILDDNCRYVRRRPGEEFLPQCLKEKVKHPTKVMVWSVISPHGPGRLHIVKNMMNAVQYRDVLENRLLPQLREWFPDGNTVFMQDSAPCHTANLIKGFFTDIGLEVLHWPGNSPDLNPIEGIWFNLKERVNEVISTNKRDLIERIIGVWHRNRDIPTLIEKYYASMPNRIAAVITVKGGSTKY
jgi:transposase